jgi:hypothetical protein
MVGGIMRHSISSLMINAYVDRAKALVEIFLLDSVPFVTP